MLIVWASSSFVIQMFKRMQLDTWVVFIFYFVISVYREKIHTQGAELVDWQAALKHPCSARFTCFIPTRWILIYIFFNYNSTPTNFLFSFFSISSVADTLYSTRVSSRHCWRTEELNLWNVSICIGYEITGFLFQGIGLSFTTFICKAFFVQTPQGSQVAESSFYTAPCDNVLVVNDSLNGVALVWLSKVKIRLPRPSNQASSGSTTNRSPATTNLYEI